MSFLGFVIWGKAKGPARLGWVVEAIDRPFVFSGGCGDIDIVTETHYVEVKSGKKMKLTQSEKNSEYATSHGKQYLLYMPQATSNQIYDASKKGITVIKSEELLKQILIGD